MNFSFFPIKWIYITFWRELLSWIRKDLKKHENGNLRLSRIHIGLNHTEDRIINYIYLKDNKLYSLGENILKCPEWSHTEISRENTLKTLK